MNFFHNLTRSFQDQDSDTETEATSPFDYLADRQKEGLAAGREGDSAQIRHEQEFQARVANAKEVEAWLRPLLQDLQEAAYPEDKVFGFIHWINQDDDCPWILLTPSLDYGPRHQGARADLIHWETHPQPRIHWSVGSYPDHPYVKEQAWAYQEKVDVELMYEDGRPERLRIRVGGHNGKTKKCKARLLDLTKALVQLHP